LPGVFGIPSVRVMLLPSADIVIVDEVNVTVEVS